MALEVVKITVLMSINPNSLGHKCNFILISLFVDNKLFSSSPTKKSSSLFHFYSV